MDKKNIEHFKNRLYEEKANLSDAVERINDINLGDNLRDSTSELSLYDNHPADIASETFEVEKYRALKANEEYQLKMIDGALDRIERGSYGKCEICGKDINEERLEVIPYATLCIECEKKDKPNYLTYFQDRPVEETVLGYPFASTNKDDDDYTGYDGEDTWQELESFNSVNYMAWDDAEDESTQGIVESTDKLSNTDYRRQLPD